MNITERAAKYHVSNLLRKLGLEKRRNLLVLETSATPFRNALPNNF
ncbi:MAG: hypothetical protein DMG42_01145 [Acidobacteria bacterium]|nr:MAG: hypothetical protein DMG42_01145 [Acidobacteriota bacterium]